VEFRHETPESWLSCVPLSGLETTDYVDPAEDSTSVSRLLDEVANAPTATQLVEVQDTPKRALIVAPGSGLDAMDQLLPSHVSMSDWTSSFEEPTATQLAAAVHDTPLSTLYPVPLGLGVTDHMDRGCYRADVGG